jgi:hypothetical protein
MNRSSFVSWPAGRLARAAPVAAGLALAAAVVSAGQASAAPAALPSNCTHSGPTVTCTYGYTGNEQTFTVPAGVTSVHVTAIGAAGGRYGSDYPGGSGGSAAAAFSVTPGATLYVEVGGTGGGVQPSNSPGGSGGFNGGGHGAAGDDGSNGQPGGGGASDVRLLSAGLVPPDIGLSSRVIVAGGGGGTSALNPGGSAGQPGSGGRAGAGPGGGAGTATAGGAAGGPEATSGVLGRGGVGGMAQPQGPDRSHRGGSGGGGGYYGGGGGGLGAGGGGGSSFVPVGGTTGLSGAPASVTISYAASFTATTTTVSSSANPSVAGQRVTFTATVSPVPDGGTVAFTEGGTAITGCGAVTVDTATGTATCPVTYTSAGAHLVVAGYSGHGAFGASSGSLTQIVNKEATTTVVTSSANPSAARQPVTFTATVSGPPGTGTPTGQVTFSAGGTPIGTGMLDSSGTAQTATSSLTAGHHTITAVYHGDSTFYASSAQLTQTVSKIATSTTVVSSANPSIIDAPVTYTASVHPASGTGTPTGTVAFTEGGTPIAGCGSVAVSNTGTATCPVTYTAVGSHTITAAYSGDATHAGSTSAALTQQVAYNVLHYSTSHGSSVLVQLQLLNAAGANLSAAGITVTVTGLSPSPAPGTPPTGTFTFTTLDLGPGYQLNVKINHYPADTYTLSFTASGDPTTHTVQFVIS